MAALVVLPPLVLLLVGLGVGAGWSVITQTRRVHPEAPGSGDGGGGGIGPVEDSPAGGGGPELSLHSPWALQDDVDVFLLLQRENAH
jgi:hypothetical protein